MLLRSSFLAKSLSTSQIFPGVLSGGYKYLTKHHSITKISHLRDLKLVCFCHNPSIDLIENTINVCLMNNCC